VQLVLNLAKNDFENIQYKETAAFWEIQQYTAAH
jgi:hypothetical protein